MVVPQPNREMGDLSWERILASVEAGVGVRP